MGQHMSSVLIPSLLDGHSKFVANLKDCGHQPWPKFEVGRHPPTQTQEISEKRLIAPWHASATCERLIYTFGLKHVVLPTRTRKRRHVCQG